MRPRHLLLARAGLLALSAILAFACSDSDGNRARDPAREPSDRTGEPGDLVPVPATGANKPVSATLDSDGGSISATAVDGTRYTLDVPPHALREPTEITLTPIASFENFPVAAGASAAVLFEPDGLTFTVPAELTIVAPAPLSPVSVAFSQSGATFALAPARVDGQTAQLQIGHFSSGGTTSPTPDEVAALAPDASNAEASARHGVVQELNRAATAGEHPNTSVVVQHLKAWFDGGVMPGLEAAAAGSRDIEDALGEWLRWFGTVQTWADGHLEEEIDAAQAAAAAATRASIQRLNQECLEKNDPALAGAVVHLAGLSALLGFDEIDPALSVEAILADLCMRIAIEATLPDPFVDGSTLEVRAGLAIGDHPADYTTPLDLMLSSVTASLSQTSGRTDQDGLFTTEVTLEPDTEEVVIEIRATHPAAAQLSAVHTVRAPVGYELIFRVNGRETAQLAPGDTAQLEVTVRKAEAPLSGATVAFSVDGDGSVDPASITTDADGIGTAVYTAPDDVGSVTITASFTAGASELTRTVTIDVTESGDGEISLTEPKQLYSFTASFIPDDPEVVWEHDELYTEGSLSRTYSVDRTHGAYAAAGSITHESQIIQDDPLALLIVTAKAEIEGTATAGDVTGSAKVTGGSTVRAFFEVLHAPVYYELRATGTCTPEGYAHVQLLHLEAYSGPAHTVAHKEWSETEDTLLAEGWLEPGLYQFDAYADVAIGAGHINLNGALTASGAMAHEVEFHVYDSKPPPVAAARR